MALLLNYSSEQIRLFFRIYFIILGTIIVPLGGACSSVRVKLSLSKGKDVRLTRMLGWLGGWDCIATTWRTRAFPSGALFTLLMLVAYFVGLASDLVGTYIRPVQVHDRCSFGTGLVLSSTRSLFLTPWNGYPYTVVSQAQARSIANDGQQGIYAKVNQDASFSADTSDLLGGWQCGPNPLELDYSNQQSPADIANDLLKHDLLYSNATVSSMYSGLSQNNFEHLVLVDTSNKGTAGLPWDIRVSVSTSDPGATTMTMLSFQCTLRDDIGWLTDTLKGMSTMKTIPDWIQLIQGSCYSGTGTPVRPDLSKILERVFNSMVMISSGGNYLLDTSQATSTQGCLTSRTWILWEVIALAAVAAGLNLFLAVYLLVLKMRERRFNKGDHPSATSGAKEDMKTKLVNVPGDLLGWMVQTIKESEANTQSREADAVMPKKRELKTWSFGWHDTKSRFAIVTGGENAEEIELLASNT